jgi:hypothetical protein
MLDRSRITRDLDSDALVEDGGGDRDNFHEVNQWFALRKFLY